MLAPVFMVLRVELVAGILVARSTLAAIPIRWPRVAAQIPAYAIGTFAAFWVLERVSALL